MAKRKYHHGFIVANSQIPVVGQLEIFKKNNMYQVFWELKVKYKDRDKMEHFYDAKGEWVKFFQKANGYEGTEVLESGEGDNTFLVIDEWQSEEDFNACIQNRKADFALLEEKANAVSRVRKRIFIAWNRR